MYLTHIARMHTVYVGLSDYLNVINLVSIASYQVDFCTPMYVLLLILAYAVVTHVYYLYDDST